MKVIRPAFCGVLAGLASLGMGGEREARGAATPSQTGVAPADAAYKDSSLPFDERVADLIKWMTLEEKASDIQMRVASGTSPEVARLGISPVNWWSEAIHGMSRAGNATIFPQAIAMAAAWDPGMMQKVGDATANEARAKLDPNGAQYRGIMLWAPTINMARDPRWGRVEETYGEDPYLTGRLSVSFIKGLQGDDPKYLKTVATPKHFAMHSQETQRMSRSFDCPETVLRDYYLPAFRDSFVEGKAMSTMAAFSGINHIPATANFWLLTDLLRREWGFEGAVVTDWGAVTRLKDQQNYVATLDQAVTAAINAGVDVICDGDATGIRNAIVQAVNEKSLKMEILDRALSRNLMVRFRLGFFDPPSKVPFKRQDASAVGSKENQALALQAALESVVLLKNEPTPRGYGVGRLLPLDLKRIDSIAVLGPYANANQYGAYSAGSPANPAPTIFSAIRTAVGDRVTVRNEIGMDAESNIRAAQQSSVVVYVCGINGQIEKEGADRSSLNLPADQINLLQKIVKANPLTVVLVEGGSPVALEAIRDLVPAMMMIWYPGEQGGVAIAKLLLGEANPGGKLPLTFYRSQDDLPPLDDYDIRKGRTYMYATKAPTYVFGAGLSYTTFDYHDFSVSPGSVTGADTVTVKVKISNTGSMAGDEVVQLYFRVKSEAGGVDLKRPIKQLKGFQRVSVPVGASREVTFSVPMESLGYWDASAKKYVPDKGVYEFMVGSSSEDIRGKAEVVVK
jgi:beta-glucosidase